MSKPSAPPPNPLVFPQDKFFADGQKTYREGGITLMDLFAVAIMGADYTLNEKDAYRVAEKCLHERMKYIGKTQT